MFKLKKTRIRQDDITRDYDKPGSYLGVIFSHKPGENYWKIVHYNKSTKYYKRCRIVSHKEQLNDIIVEPFKYSHKEIKRSVTNNEWKIVY
jgi:hypothetical protein